MIITCFTDRTKMHDTIVTSNYQKVHGYIRSLTIIPRAVFDANSAVGFVHYLRRNTNIVKTCNRYAIMIFEQISTCVGGNEISNFTNI